MGTIYKLTDGVLNYYGSTQTTLEVRLNDHKKKNNKSYSNKLNKENMTINMVELVENLEDLTLRERYYIENNECVNNNIPARTTAERQDYLTNYHANYYNQRKEKLQSMYKCACGKMVKFNNNKHKFTKEHLKNLI